MAERGVEETERDEELAEERKAADGKPRRLTVEVVEPPKIKRSADGRVSSVDIVAKALFKGEVRLRLRGDIASAYWSVTPGMRLSVLAVERGDKDYEVGEMDLLSAS